jgi:hypothetical protein
MRGQTFVLAAAAVMGASIGTSTASLGDFERQTPADVQRLAWLGGCWQQRSGARVVEEHWMAPRGGVMLGMSRTARNDTVIEYEQLRIFQRGSRVVYAAAPSGQAAAEFETSAIGDTLVVFENPAHDFPQRIIYRRRGADSVVARIEGLRGGVVRGVDFGYRKVGCG